MDSNPFKSGSTLRDMYADLSTLRKNISSRRLNPVIVHAQRTQNVSNTPVQQSQDVANSNEQPATKKRKVSAQVDEEDDVQFVSECITVASSMRKKDDRSRTIGRSNRNEPKKLTEVDLSLPHHVVTINIALLTDSERSSNGLATYSKKNVSSPVTFTVHKSYICAASPFFEAAFNGNFKEGLSQSMTFTDIDAAHFGVFNHWVYYNTIKCLTERDPQSQTLRGNFAELGRLWLLGQRFLAPAFQNAVMDKLFNSAFSVAKGNHFCDFIKVAYNTEEEGRDMLRKVAIHRLSGLDRRFKEIALGDELVLAWKDMAFELESQVTKEKKLKSTLYEDHFGYYGPPPRLDQVLRSREGQRREEARVIMPKSSDFYVR